MEIRSIGCCGSVTQAQLQAVKDAITALGGNVADDATGNVVFENGKLYNVLNNGNKVLIPIVAKALDGDEIPLGG